MQTGRVCWCPECRIVGTLFYEHMTRTGFSKPMREKNNTTIGERR